MIRPTMRTAMMLLSLAGGSAHASIATIRPMAGGFDQNPNHAYQDDIPVYTLMPDPSGVDPQTGQVDEPSNGKLLVFLHGTGGGGNANTGVGHLNFLHAAASQGYHVISLDYYQGQDTPRSNCGCDTYCYGYLRNQQLDDTMYSLTPRTSPTPATYYVPGTTQSAMQQWESVESRLTTVLTYLEAALPGSGWDSYLENGSVVWSTVVMAGHSQGAGLAAFTAKKQSVQGVIMFSGIMDSVNECHAKDQWTGALCRTGSTVSSVPNWVSDNHFGTNTGYQWATSDIYRFYGVRGTRDTNTHNADNTSAVLENWNALQLQTAHASGNDDGYGTIDLDGQDGNDYSGKKRHGLYAGSGNDTFSYSLDGDPNSLGTPDVSGASSSETCQAGHDSVIADDSSADPGVCDGGDWYGTWSKLDAAWLYLFDALASKASP